MATYKEELTKAMGMLAANPKTLFVGQSVRFGGQAMFPTLAEVPMEQRIELPVAEDFQMGFCTGMAIEGFIPISVYPRFDFLLLAANQLVNHLDKIAQVSGYRPKVIIRTAIGSTSPLNPGPQHCQNHVDAFRLMLKNIMVLDLRATSDIAYSYDAALKLEGPVLLVEHAEMYSHE
jgi:pyruvate/2-oxoglutarate/acetoin dehydrogenase E1 component